MITPSDRRDDTLLTLDSDVNAVDSQSGLSGVAEEEASGVGAARPVRATSIDVDVNPYGEDEEETPEPEADPFDPTMGGIINWMKLANFTASLKPKVKQKLWAGVFKKKPVVPDEPTEDEKVEEMIEEKLDSDAMPMGTVLIAPANDVVEEEPADQVAEEKAPQKADEEEVDTPEVAKIKKLLKVLTLLFLTGVESLSGFYIFGTRNIFRK